VIQESLRLLQLTDPVYVSLEATSVWRARDPQKSFAERRLSLDSIWRFALDGVERLVMEKETIDYQSQVFNKLGPARIKTFIAGNTIPDFSKFRDMRVKSIERAMLLCGYGATNTEWSHLDRIRWLALGFVSRRLIARPLQWTASECLRG
jgi:hypothetical protein